MQPGLEELVKKIFSDEKAMLEFKSDPERVLSKFSLSEDEIRAVMISRHKLGLAGADSQAIEGPVLPAGFWY